MTQRSARFMTYRAIRVRCKIKAAGPNPSEFAKLIQEPSYSF